MRFSRRAAAIVLRSTARRAISRRTTNRGPVRARTQWVKPGGGLSAEAVLHNRRSRSRNTPERRIRTINWIHSIIATLQKN
jgi:hypothetical protein